MEPIEKMVLQLIRREAALAEDTLEQIKEMNKTLDVSKLRRKRGAYEGRLSNCKHRKMKLYEKFASGELTKDEYLEQKKFLLEKEEKYEEQVNMLAGEITESEKQKAKEKDPGLQAFIKCKDLETLSYPIVQELIETIYFYDPEHIEVIWKYRDEYVRKACAVKED